MAEISEVTRFREALAHKNSQFNLQLGDTMDYFLPVEGYGNIDLMALNQEIKDLQRSLTYAKSENVNLNARWITLYDRDVQKLQAALDKYKNTENLPARKLREVKFRNGLTHRVRDGVLEYHVHHNRWTQVVGISPDDAEAYLALKADPYEPAVDVRAAVQDIVYHVSRKPLHNSEVDAAVAEIVALVRGERA
jgi:hypothetical protein